MATADQDCAQRIEELVQKVDRIPDPESRETARQLMEAVLEFHGAGLNRMMELACEAGGPGEALIRRFAADSLVASLLVLHDLHPDDLETRVRRALAKWHGNAELINEFEGIVRVRVTGGGPTAKQDLEAAIREAAPDVVEVIIEAADHNSGGFVPLAALGMSVARAE